MMNHRTLLLALGILAGVVFLAVGCDDQDAPSSAGARQESAMTETPNNASFEITRTEEEWKAQLSDEQFRVMRCGGTERAFTGQYWNHKDDGTYVCGSCGQDLYRSDDKFDSGTGWPSFTQAVENGRVTTRTDRSAGMVRTEALCSRCGAHLGHIFEDGPAPTGMRHCINSASLNFRADK